MNNINSFNPTVSIIAEDFNVKCSKKYSFDARDNMRKGLNITIQTIHLPALIPTKIFFHEDILTHSRPLLQSLNALNIYQINLYENANFMCKF